MLAHMEDQAYAKFIEDLIVRYLVTVLQLAFEED